MSVSGVVVAMKTLVMSALSAKLPPRTLVQLLLHEACTGGKQIGMTEEEMVAELRSRYAVVGHSDKVHEFADELYEEEDARIAAQKAGTQ